MRSHKFSTFIHVNPLIILAVDGLNSAFACPRTNSPYKRAMCWTKETTRRKWTSVYFFQSWTHFQFLPTVLHACRLYMLSSASTNSGKELPAHPSQTNLSSCSTTPKLHRRCHVSRIAAPLGSVASPTRSSSSPVTQFRVPSLPRPNELIHNIWKRGYNSQGSCRERKRDANFFTNASQRNI